MRSESTTAPRTIPTSTGHARVPVPDPGAMADAVGNSEGPTVVLFAALMEGLEDTRVVVSTRRALPPRRPPDARQPWAESSASEVGRRDQLDQELSG